MARERGVKIFGLNIRRAERRNDSASGEIDKAINSYLVGADMSIPRPMTTEGSLSLSAVWRCVNILSETVAILPLHLYQKDNHIRKRNRTHAVYHLLNRPNSYSTRFDAMRYLMMSCVLWGNGYARIIRDKHYRPISLKFLHPYAVSPHLSDNDNLFYRLSNGEIVGGDNILHIKGTSTNGYKGKSPITIHRENLQLAMYAQDYGSKFFSQGGNMSGVFQHPGELNDDQFKRLKLDLDRRVLGVQNALRPMLLEGGMTYDRISIPPEDAQYIETRKFQATEIARMFGIPPHMIADLERSTNNNIEHQSIEFVTYSLMPYLIRIEQEFNRKLLREDEFEALYLKFEIKNLLRGDAKTRSEYYKNMHLAGVMTPNEIRSLEEMNEYDGGNDHYVQMNMQTVENARVPQNKNNNENKKE